MSRLDTKAGELKAARRQRDVLLLDNVNKQHLTEFFQYITEINSCLQPGDPEYNTYQERKNEVISEVRKLRRGNEEVESFVFTLTGHR